ncbi:hypothetical protein KAU11_10485 [Candidatus Babeliales bacterium]|nr:hypothetical protein [Candidatus Babeliales bacterium]
MDTNLRFDGKLFSPGPEWSGYTTAKHLANARMTNPKWGSDIMTYIGTANSKAMSYEHYLKLATNTVYEETDEPINFMVYGDGRRYATLIKYIADDRNRVGINKSRFTLVFDAPFFSDVHLIVGMSDRYKIRMVSDAEETNGGWSYTCEVFGPAASFIPASELIKGSTWSREGAPVPMTDSMKGAKTSYSSPYAITFDWSSVSTQDDVPGNMKTRPVAFAWKNEDGSEDWTWEDHRTFKNDMHFQDLKATTLVWGTSNRNSAGDVDDIDERSGQEIIQGSGIVQQMERGNLHYYNTFDIEEFTEHLLSLRVGKKATDITRYVVSTGTRGLVQAHNSIKAQANGWEKIDNESIFGTREKLGFGQSFTRYLHPAGFEVDFRLEPMLDDDSRTRVPHPKGGYARSYEYHVMDLGQTNGEDNVSMHYVKDMVDTMAILKGFRNPYSPTGERVVQEVASLKDAWSERRMSQFMAVIKNPKNTMIYRPNIFY